MLYTRLHMAQRLHMLNAPVERRLLHNGTRIFALLGKATRFGIAPFGPEDVHTSWAVTAEFGCIRLERLSGDEEVTSMEAYLPTPLSYDYGITGMSGAPEITRLVFGLLPAELEQLVTLMRRGTFPVLGYSATEVKCGVSSGIVPGRWPHILVSNLVSYGNVLSLEMFARIIIASMPHGNLFSRYPALRPVFKEMLRLIVVQRRGFPYSREMLGLAPAEVSALK